MTRRKKEEEEGGGGKSRKKEEEEEEDDDESGWVNGWLCSCENRCGFVAVDIRWNIPFSTV